MLTRLALVLTTRRPGARELAETGLDRLAADLSRAGWRLRFAGPRWDTVWARQWQTPLEQRILVLPDPGRGGWGHDRWAGHSLPPFAAGYQWRPLIAQRLRHFGGALG